MREILFRGKSTIGLNPIITGFLLHDQLMQTYSIAWKPDDDNWQITPVFEDSVGQFTGLTDKNGIKVFEGDITDRKTIILFNEKKSLFCEYYQNNFSGKFYVSSYPMYADFKIIGNIHDNPELLK